MTEQQMKRQFIKQNFLMLFTAFIIPVLIAGLIIIGITISDSKNETKDKLNRSLRIIYDDFDSMYNNYEAIRRFTENTSISVLSKMLESGSVDYAESLAIRQFLAYIASASGNNPWYDSVYFYVRNPQNRVFTSTFGFTFSDSLVDSQWLQQLTSMGKTECIIIREKRDYPFETPQKVLSIFYRFKSYDGGIVVNYDVSKIKNSMEAACIFDSQIITIANGNEILISNSETSTTKNERFLQVSVEYPKIDLIISTSIEAMDVDREIAASLRLILIILSLLLVISIFLAFSLSQKSYKEINAVEQVFKEVSDDSFKGYSAKPSNDLYLNLLNNVISIFIEKKYLATQLSERQFRQKTAELQALQYQINPHFLYNALQTINYEIMDITKGEQVKANKMIEDLSDIIRYSLSDPSAPVPLSKEIDICNKYISIQSIRYQNNFRVIWKIEKTLYTHPVPCMILEPIIENAIIHGLRYKKVNPVLSVHVKKQNDKIRFSVFDNGTGIAPEKLKELRMMLTSNDSVDFSAEHIGLKNCSQRLKLKFGESSNIRIYSSLNKGTLIVFIIPASFSTAL